MEKQLLINVQPQRGVTLMATNESADVLTAVVSVCLVALTAAMIARMLTR